MLFCVVLGDDGSPLTKTPDSPFAYDPEVVGIASYTTGPCTEPGAAVFMNLHAYKDWITSTCESYLLTLKLSRLLICFSEV